MPNNNVTTLWNGSEQMTGQDAANTADAIIYHTPGGGVSTVQQALDNSSSSVPVGSVMTFDGSVLPGGYEPYQTQEQRDIATLNDNLTASNDTPFRFEIQGGVYGYLKADDSFAPFSSKNFTMVVKVTAYGYGAYGNYPSYTDGNSTVLATLTKNVTIKCVNGTITITNGSGWSGYKETGSQTDEYVGVRLVSVNLVSLTWD